MALLVTKMGWYCKLLIGKQAWYWRKHIPPEVVILFVGEYKIVRPLVSRENGFATSSENSPFVGFRSTVARTKRALDSLGLTREFFEALYASYRPGFLPYALGYLEGFEHAIKFKLAERGGLGFAEPTGHMPLSLSDVECIRRTTESGNATREFEAAITLLRDYQGRSWKAYLGEEPPLIPNFKLEPPSSLIDEEILRASMLGMFLEYAEQDLPEIAWLIQVRLVLDASSPNSRVRLSLRDWVEEGGDLDELLPWAIEQLASKVSAYQQTFDAITGGDETICREVARRRLRDNWNRLFESGINSHEKGKRLEAFVEALIDCSSGLIVVQKNIRNATEELDMVVKNQVGSPFWSSLNSPLIFVECKNWSTPVGVKEARVFESKLRQSLTYCRIGIFVALNGTTEPFRVHVRTLYREGIAIAIITREDVEEILESRELEMIDWLESIITRDILSGQ